MISPTIVMGIHIIIPGEEVHIFKIVDGTLKELEDGITHKTIIIAIDLTRVDLEVLIFQNNSNQVEQYQPNVNLSNNDMQHVCIRTG